MARTTVDSSQLPRPVLLTSTGLMAKIVPLSTVSAVLTAQGKNSKRERALPADFLVYYTIALSLYMSYPLREVLRCVLDGFQSLDTKVNIATKGAISRARGRLGWQVLAEIFAQVVHPIATPKTRGSWCGRWRVVAVDGTTLAVQCTPENVAEFGLHDSDGIIAAFPLVRMVTLVEVGTHVVIRPVIGNLKQAEVVLAEDLVPALTDDMLVIEDRGFVSYKWWTSVRSTGAEVLCRLRKDMRFPCDKRLEDGSYLSRMRVPSGVDGAQITVRIIEYTLKGVPGAEPLYRIATSILDPEAAPAQELATLYHERWEAENIFDEFKTHLRGGNHVLLRSKTPDLVRQETYGLLLAHYIVRVVMHDAALEVGEDPDNISFTHTVRVLKRRLPQVAKVFSPSASDTIL